MIRSFENVVVNLLNPRIKIKRLFGANPILVATKDITEGVAASRSCGNPDLGEFVSNGKKIVDFHGVEFKIASCGQMG